MKYKINVKKVAKHFDKPAIRLSRRECLKWLFEEELPREIWLSDSCIDSLLFMFKINSDGTVIEVEINKDKRSLNAWNNVKTEIEIRRFYNTEEYFDYNSLDEPIFKTSTTKEIQNLQSYLESVI